MTSEQALILQAANNKLKEELNWLYDEIKDYKIKKKELEELTKKHNEKEFKSLKDACELIKWEKGKDTPKRNRLQSLSNDIAIINGIDHTSSATIVYKFILKVIKTKDKVDDPFLLLMSKKEARKHKKLRRRENSNEDKTRKKRSRKRTTKKEKS